MLSFARSSSATASEHSSRAAEDAEIRRRLAGGVNASLIAQELLRAGSSLEEAAARVACLQRKTLLLTAVGRCCTAVVFAVVGIFLMAELRSKRVGPIFLAFGAIHFVGTLLRLIGAARPGRAQCLARDVAGSIARVDEGTVERVAGDLAACTPEAPERSSLEWLAAALRDGCEARIRSLRWMALLCLAGVVTAPFALMCFWSIRGMRRGCEHAIDLLQRGSPALVWAYLEVVEHYGFTFASLALGEVTAKGKGRLVLLPIPTADAERILAAVASHLPGIHIGKSREAKRRFRRDPRSLRSVPTAALHEAKSSAAPIGASILALPSRRTT